MNIWILTQDIYVKWTSVSKLTQWDLEQHAQHSLHSCIKDTM